MVPVDAQALLAGLERRAGARAAEHDATLDTTLLATGLVRVDPVRVEQAILALVDNAVKYCPEGQRVILSSACTDGELRIEVEAYRRPNSHSSSSASTAWPKSGSWAAVSVSR